MPSDGLHTLLTPVGLQLLPWYSLHCCGMAPPRRHRTLYLPATFAGPITDYLAIVPCTPYPRLTGLPWPDFQAAYRKPGYKLRQTCNNPHHIHLNGNNNRMCSALTLWRAGCLLLTAPPDRCAQACISQDSGPAYLRATRALLLLRTPVHLLLNKPPLTSPFLMLTLPTA